MDLYSAIAPDSSTMSGHECKYMRYHGKDQF